MHSRPNLDDSALHRRWQALADTAAATPFLSWTWVGCLAAERFTDPVLVEQPGALALFNRRRGAWFLNESGDSRLDAVFTEHNGALGGADALPAILAAVRRQARKVVLSGIDDQGLAAVRAAGGIIIGLNTRAAPYATLDPARPHADRLSRNTRAQLRRSDRSYAASGPLRAERAETVNQALDWLGCMLPLHEATWAARGIASAFAAAPVQRFHRALLARGVPTGEVDLLRIAAGSRVIGYLLNLRAHGRVHAYQSGFDYAAASPHEKPGLTCHYAAIERARALGDREYDVLAGDARYKRSLATGSRDLHWLTWKPRPALFGLELVARRVLQR